MSVDRINAIVERTNALEPDAVMLLGDYVAGRTHAAVRQSHRRARLGEGPRRPRGAARRPCRARQSRLVGRPRGAASAARADRGPARPRSGRHPRLRERAVRLVKNGQPFWIAGLGDQESFCHDGNGTARADHAKAGYATILPATLALVTDDAPVILMAHEPDIFAHDARTRRADGQRTHARRAGPPARIARRPSPPSYGTRYHLRPHRRGSAPPDRLVGPRLQRVRRPLRRAARDRHRGAWNLVSRRAVLKGIGARSAPAARRLPAMRSASSRCGGCGCSAIASRRRAGRRACGCAPP